MTTENTEGGTSSDPSNSDVEELRKSLCEAVEKCWISNRDDRLVDWINGKRESIYNFDFCDSAISFIKEGTPTKAVVEICEELCLTALSMERYDDSPEHEKIIGDIRYEVGRNVRPLHAAKTIIKKAWVISEENYCIPPLPGDPERITREEIKIVNTVIAKAIRWNESNQLSKEHFDATIRLPEKGTGKHGGKKINPTLSWLMLELHDLYTSVGFNNAKSSRFIAAWINHFGNSGHSWLTKYNVEGKPTDRTPNSIERYLHRNRKKLTAKKTYPPRR